MKKLNNYNAVAKYYDFISQLVFGKKLIQAQSLFLDSIQAENQILIIGGGTGKILNAINTLGKRNLSVTFLDASQKMIDLAKKRNYENLNVQFICERIEFFETKRPFDVIMTPFFFDNFEKDKIDFLFPAIAKLLNNGGLWMYTDFNLTYKKRWIDSILVKIMYLFFKITSRIETQKLIDMQSYFSNYQLIKEHRGFICSRLYKSNY